MQLEDIDVRSLKEVANCLKTNRGYDFSDYAMSSFKRRLIRAIDYFKLNSVEELIFKIKADKVFAEILVKEITVNTTEMFRDPSFWRELRDKLIPGINTTNNIRIWHSACSSGEEVYSMCILLKEMNLLDKCILVATDLNDEVIERAKNGIYPKRNLEIHDANYKRFIGKAKLNDYYSEFDANNVKFNSDLLKQVTFKKHDLVLGDPFSKFDLILCRNVLIYFNMKLQDNVLKLFESSLFPKSYLAIGSKETIAWCTSAKNFKTISAEEKIYQKINSNLEQK